MSELKPPSIPDVVYERVDVQQSDADRAHTFVLSFDISDQEGYEGAAGFLSEIKAKQKEFKAEKDALVKPLREVIRQITDIYAPPLSKLEDAEKALKAELKRYKAEADAAHKKMLTDAQSPEEVAKAIEVLADKPSNISERVTWKWEIVDESKVPKDYWVLDEKRINREARMQRDQLCIPGIKPVRDTVMVARSK